MKLQTRHLTYGSLLAIFSLLLVFVLAACGTGGTDTGTAVTPTPTPSPTPSPTPTPTLTAYAGDGYSIGYAKGWTSKVSGNIVTFSDATGANTLVIQVIPNPNGTVPTSSSIDTTLSAFQKLAKKYEKVTIAPTTTVAGDTWDQAAATGDLTESGQTVNMKAVLLADIHPAHSASSKTYLITYTAPSASFDAAYTMNFQAMLQSFKFA